MELKSLLTSLLVLLIVFGIGKATYNPIEHMMANQNNECYQCVLKIIYYSNVVVVIVSAVVWIWSL